MTAHPWKDSRIIALAFVLAACSGRDHRGGTPSASLANPALLHERAPATFRARFETTAGDFVIEAHRDWAPFGADRFYNLVKGGYFDGVRFFRVISGFMAQFGIHGDPHVAAAWRDQRIPDDPVHESNTRGMVSFATAGPDTRTTQLFINYGDNRRLDGSGFAPFGQVVDGMEVVDRLYAGYGEGAPGGQGPDQGRIEGEGNAYLGREFPKLDQVRRAMLVAP
jgi:peptidyl-prolyl cis-trans isomerase A (cyclophilin A)